MSGDTIMAFEAELHEIRDDVKSLKKLLTGNGEPGLCEKVRKVEDRVDMIEKKPFRIKEWLIFMITVSTFFVLLYQVIGGIQK